MIPSRRHYSIHAPKIFHAVGSVEAHILRPEPTGAESCKRDALFLQSCKPCLVSELRPLVQGAQKTVEIVHANSTKSFPVLQDRAAWSGSDAKFVLRGSIGRHDTQSAEKCERNQ